MCIRAAKQRYRDIHYLPGRRSVGCRQRHLIWGGTAPSLHGQNSSGRARTPVELCRSSTWPLVRRCQRLVPPPVRRFRQGRDCRTEINLDETHSGTDTGSGASRCDPWRRWIGRGSRAPMGHDLHTRIFGGTRRCVTDAFVINTFRGGGVASLMQLMPGDDMPTTGASIVAVPGRHPCALLSALAAKACLSPAPCYRLRPCTQRRSTSQSPPSPAPPHSRRRIARDETAGLNGEVRRAGDQTQ